MNKTQIATLLHHRSPYLLIDEVIEVSKDSIHAVAKPTMNDFYLQGHFPGAPIVPGAMMQEMTTQAAGILLTGQLTNFYSPVENYNSDTTKGYALGVLRAIHMAKYKSMAKPDQVLNIKVSLTDQIENSFRFKAFIKVNDKKVMQNEFTLVNISDEPLFE